MVNIHDPLAQVQGELPDRPLLTISLDFESNHLIIQLQDFNVDPVEIPEAGRVDVTKPLTERAVGGLGIHLVKSLVDKLTYEYKDRILSVTATKNLEG